MTRSGDHEPEMSLTWLLDDETSEAIMRLDEQVDPRLDRLVMFAHQVRELGHGPSPSASPALRGLIASGGGGGHDPARRRRRDAPPMHVTDNRKSAGLGFAAKLGLGTAAAALSMTGAAAAGVLPDQANDAVRHAVEVVTPVEFTEPTHEHPTNFGERVSRDATGASDGVNGVDGDVISDEAPGAAHRRVDPGKPQGNGRGQGSSSSRADPPGQGPPPHAGTKGPPEAQRANPSVTAGNGTDGSGPGDQDD
jgi:hypothetical protein